MRSCYGAALLHKIPDAEDPKRKWFLGIYDKQPRRTLLDALHMSLRLLMNCVDRITMIIYRDSSRWLRDYGLPLPDARWREQLLQIKAVAEPGAVARLARKAGWEDGAGMRSGRMKGADRRGE